MEINTQTQKEERKKRQQQSMSTTSSSCSTTSKSENNGSNPCNDLFGVHGVRLKHFEHVVANILPTVQPIYTCLPPRPFSTSHDWPFDQLPSSARVYGTGRGQIKDPQRAARKEGQLRSMIQCIVSLLPPTTNTINVPAEQQPQQPQQQQQHHHHHHPFTIVDFGGGSGHLGIPLALLLPHCQIVVVDLRKQSLDLMHEKVDGVLNQLQSMKDPTFKSTIAISSLPPSSPSCLLGLNESNSTRIRPAYRQMNGEDASAATFHNLYSFHGPIEEYTGPCDMALALHVCGEATDVSMRRAANLGASVMVVAPCCVGKLSRRVHNPNIYHATQQNKPTVSYPQSKTFCQLIPPNGDDWDALVQAADYSDVDELRTVRNATRRTAKALLETDRRLFLEQSYGYQTALVRMDPWEVTPKNDILLAWKSSSSSSSSALSTSTLSTSQFTDPTIPKSLMILDEACHVDIQNAQSHVLGMPLPESQPTETYDTSQINKQIINGVQSHGGGGDTVDWTMEEEQEIQETIMNFLHATESYPTKMEEVLVFPTRMGSRRRKCIHFVAGKLDLAHWSEGKKVGDKTVAVARRGRRTTQQRLLRQQQEQQQQMKST